MPDDLCSAFLEQSPACQWIVSRQQIFEQVFGDPFHIFGKTAAELRGHSLAETLDPEHATAWTHRFNRALHGETLLLRERRTDTAWSISVFPVRLEGEIRYAGALAREATAWNKAEQELRYTVLGALKAQEFERNMASKFLHDSVGQNLTALGLQLDLIRMDLEATAPEICARIGEIQKLLEDMMES